MQSEFASHIGMNGKYFCRVCFVSNPSVAEEITDTNESSGIQQNRNSDLESDGASDHNGSVDGTMEGNEDSTAEVTEKSGSKEPTQSQSAAPGKGKRKAAPKKKQGVGKGRGKKPETLNQLIERAKEFLTVTKFLIVTALKDLCF